MRSHKSGNRRRRGGVMVYVVIAIPAMIGFTSLAVDLGQAQLAKTQLYRAADSAARYGATGLSDSTYSAKAIDAANDNLVAGSPLVLTAADIQTGTWNTSTRVFTATSVSPNALKITAHRTAARGTAIKTPWASVLGRSTVDVSASAIATYTAATSTVINVPGGADPWLAGMPSGTTANFTNQTWLDKAPANSPIQASAITLKDGAILNFNFSGSVSYYPGTQPFNCDGDPDWIINNYYAGQNGGEHGMSDLKAPLCSIIGVFLDANQPDSAAAGPVPAVLDFTTTASRDFASLSPALKQPFFIGDGLRADGVTKQNFVVPTGATRLFIGIMDGQQWSDNSGSMSTTVVKPAIISTVK